MSVGLFTYIAIGVESHGATCSSSVAIVDFLPIVSEVMPEAAMYGGYSQGSLPLDPLSQPLPVASPSTWPDRERRVEWCLRNLTRGEKALLYRLLHDTERLRLEQCAALERAERAALAGAK